MSAKTDCRSKSRLPSFWRTVLVTSIVYAAFSGVASNAATIRHDFGDFNLLSLEELGSIKITSVSKKSERLDQAPAAVSVITGPDIRRSGALTLSEALRLAPGVQVARVDAAQTAVSVRGFNDTFAQNLLVLIDGRSVYTPLFSGTVWQAQDTMLDDVDRIEVIRGPGASVWGANAVNGVINVVTKSARETQGLLLSGGGGTERPAIAGARYGTQLSEKLFIRMYGKYDSAGNSQLVGGGDANDAWRKKQGGFRLDWNPNFADHLTLQGDVFDLRQDQTSPQIVLPKFPLPPPATGYHFSRPAHWDQTGHHLLGRWTHQFSGDSDFSLQTYYDRGTLSTALLGEKRDTFDLDLRHRFPLARINEIVWGGGYRLSNSAMTDSVAVNLSRHSRHDEILNAFVQDEIKLVPGQLQLTLGTKVEHNDYTGLEFQPGARLAWTVRDNQTLWTSVARAVRTPSQVERDGIFNHAVLSPSAQNPFPTLVSVSAAADFRSETLMAYELGYRIQAHSRLSVDVTAFLNDYDGLRSIDTHLDLSKLPNYVDARSVFGNQGGGQTRGGELALTWQAADGVRFYAQWSIIRATLHEPTNTLTGLRRDLGIGSPRQQASLRSSLDLGCRVELDTSLRYVDRLSPSSMSAPGMTGADATIPSYATFDIRLGWRPTKNVEFAVVGQNLAGTQREFNPTFISTSVTEVTRSLYGKITWKL